MNRRTLILLVALLLSVAYAAWQHLRPYEWGADPGARYRIDYVEAKEDHSFCWVNVHLSRHGDSNHDLRKPVVLVTPDGQEHPPASTDLEGDASQQIMSGLHFRFWLERSALAGPLHLKLNDGTLNVRTGQGNPDLSGGSRIFRTSNW